MCVCCKCPQQQARKKLATLKIHFSASFFHSLSLSFSFSSCFRFVLQCAVRKVFAVCVFRLKAGFKLCITRAQRSAAAKCMHLSPKASAWHDQLLTYQRYLVSTFSITLPSCTFKFEAFINLTLLPFWPVGLANIVARLR